MTQAVTFESNFNPKEIISGMVRRWEQALREQIAAEVREIIRRTQGGTDWMGKPFRRYSPGYEHWKYVTKKRGYGPVDLTFTGDMLRSMRWTVKIAGDEIRGEIRFNTALAARKAYANHFGRYGKKRKGPARPFFALSSEQQERISQALQKAGRI